MKKLITMIGMGALLCLVPACKKSNIMPGEASASNETEQRGLPQNPLPVVNTSMYVMLTSKPCATPQKEFNSVLVDIRSVSVYNQTTGWQEFKTIASGWDLVALQQGAIPGLNITDRLKVNHGTISKVAVTFGDNNKLVVNYKRAPCFKLATQEVILDVKGNVLAGAVNQLLLSVDICGHIGLQPVSDDNSCYILQPVMAFEGITQKKIK